MLCEREHESFSEVQYVRPLTFYRELNSRGVCRLQVPEGLLCAAQTLLWL
jgi:hypothetical protein